MICVFVREVDALYVAFGAVLGFFCDDVVVLDDGRDDGDGACAFFVEVVIKDEPAWES